MSEESPPPDSPPEPIVLGHFATYRLGPGFWKMDASARKERARAWCGALRDACDALELYLVQGIERTADVLVWSSARVAGPSAPGDFFRRRAAADNAYRDTMEPIDVIWGMTRPSEYSRAAKSAQEIDPFAARRAPYLVAYPFTKTAEWYLLGRETRQGMMNEHIRIGKQFREINQLLLYSFGLQDQEFVVVYETDDLTLFSRLVYDLRDTQARRYTKSDTPLHTGVWISPDDWARTLG
ncbi:MAG: chlorite dismutase family protein [Gemmatimonadales bacterium]